MDAVDFSKSPLDCTVKFHIRPKCEEEDGEGGWVWAQRTQGGTPNWGGLVQAVGREGVMVQVCLVWPQGYTPNPAWAS